MRVWRSGRSRKARDAARFAAPIAPPLWPPVEESLEADDSFEGDQSGDSRESGAAVEALGTEVPVSRVAEPAADIPAETSAPAPAAVQFEMQAEFLRLLEVVSTMCDHVIEYIETDRAERRVMVETLTDLGRVITDGAAAVMAAAAAGPALDAAGRNENASATPVVDLRERLIGGSMPAGPEPVIDLREPEAEWDPGPVRPAEPPAPIAHVPIPPAPDERHVPSEIAVEVRGRFGDRWVDGFEVCEVMSTPAGPRYRLRRRRDGVVLPELFEASSIRHVETFDQLKNTAPDGADEHGSASSETAASETAPADADASRHDEVSAPPSYWSRS